MLAARERGERIEEIGRGEPESSRTLALGGGETHASSLTIHFLTKSHVL